MRIVADEKIPFIKNILSDYAEVVYIPGHLINQQDVRDCDALLVRTRTFCNQHLLSHSAVQFIGSATIGTDHIDLDYCLRNGIKVANAPGCNSNSVNQYVAAALAAFSNQNKVQLKGLTLGIIGYGNVGTKVGSMAKALKMDVLVNDPPLMRSSVMANLRPLDEVLEKSDIVSIHVPLTEFGQFPTFRFFDKTMLSKLKKAKLLINTSRGEVLDEDAILEHKAVNTEFNYIVDVMANEPRISGKFVASALLATPHIAGYSADGKANGSAMILKELFKHFNIPFRDWYPEEISEIQPKELLLNNMHLSAEETAKMAILHTYNIQIDNDLLRNDLKSFETIRNNYTQRLEPQHFLPKLSRHCSETIKMLNDLGFKINAD